MESLKPNKYHITDLKQGSEEWHAFRELHIGASETPIIMEASPYKTPYQLWQEKLGEVEKEKETDSMRAGSLAESEIRAFVEDEMDLALDASVLESVPFSWMSASLDGFDESQTIICECKLNNKENHELVRKNEIAINHFYQVQKQLFISDAEYCIYASKHGEEILLTRIMPDKTVINEIIDAEKEFWNCLVNKIAPELLPKDFIEITDPSLLELGREYVEICKQIDPLEEKKKSLGDGLKAACSRSCKSTEIKISVRTQKGCVDYKKMVKEMNIDEDRYRNSPKIVKRIDVV